MTVCGWCGVPLPAREGVGRAKKYCRTTHANMASQKAQRARAKAKAPGLFYPAAPLLRALELAGMTGDEACELAGVLRGTLASADRRGGGLSVWSADRIATKALGIHPIMLWGDDWLDPTAYQEGLGEVA